MEVYNEILVLEQKNFELGERISLFEEAMAKCFFLLEQAGIVEPIEIKDLL